MNRLRHRSSNAFIESMWGYGFIAIPLIGMILFVLYPFAMTIYSSFTSWPLGSSISRANFIGIRNYISMFENPLFWQSLSNTFYYMIGIPIGLVISLGFAMLMNRQTKYETVFRVLFYIPVITSIVAITFVFQRMFMTDGGTVNNILEAIGIKNPPNWMMHPSYTKWVIIVMTIWRGMGTSIILYIAGMQGISQSLYEAARVDGANWWQMFRKITLPLLTPVTFYLIVTSVIGGAQMYVEPRLMFADNGPANSTFTTVIHLYDRTFVNSMAGYGSAVATVLAIIIFGLTAIQFWLNGRGDRLEKATTNR